MAGEGALGAVLAGSMILVFLRDWRSALIVLINIPLALMAAVVALWLSGQTINVMTLGGLALAIGILVDEATVAMENIHCHLELGQPVARAVRDGCGETAVPRLLAMLCILAVFVASFFMQGAPRAMFVPLALAVGFSMAASYLLSSTLVPVLAIGLLRHRAAEQPLAAQAATGAAAGRQPERWRRALGGAITFDRFRRGYQRLAGGSVRFRWPVVAGYLAASAAANAAVEGAGSRLRPILMTACAMLAGMLPLALALGEAGPQNAPLGRAVLGGLAAGTLATLLVLPAVFALVLDRAPARPASLDPDGPHSPCYTPSQLPKASAP